MIQEPLLQYTGPLSVNYSLSCNILLLFRVRILVKKDTESTYSFQF